MSDLLKAGVFLLGVSYTDYASCVRREKTRASEKLSGETERQGKTEPQTQKQTTDERRVWTVRLDHGANSVVSGHC